MLRNVTMTGAEVKVDWLFPWQWDTTDPDFNYDNVNGESVFWARNPEVTLRADEWNTAEIYIWEKSWADAWDKIWLQPWGYLTLTFSSVKAMNIFYATGNASDTLFVICR